MTRWVQLLYKIEHFKQLQRRVLCEMGACLRGSILNLRIGFLVAKRSSPISQGGRLVFHQMRKPWPYSTRICPDLCLFTLHTKTMLILSIHNFKVMSLLGPFPDFLSKCYNCMFASTLSFCFLFSVFFIFSFNGNKEISKKL